MSERTDPHPRTRVLFVCMGNICRSPTAEGVMRALIEAEGLGDRIEVDSAGTIGYHAGEAPDARMQEAARRRGFELDGAARQVSDEDFARFDLIVAMDRHNFRDLESTGRAREGQLRLLSHFLPPHAPRDVPDPYYGGEHGFEQVLDMIEEAGPRILEELRSRLRDR